MGKPTKLTEEERRIELVTAGFSLVVGLLFLAVALFGWLYQ